MNKVTGQVAMKGFDSFSPTNSVPSSPYSRHTHSRGNCSSTSNHFFVLVGTVVLFTLFVGCQSSQNVETLDGTFSLMNQQDVMGNAHQLSLDAPFAEKNQAPSPSPVSFKIMTFNLRFASVDDGIHLWEYRKHHVADIIDCYHPAVMGTQEGLKDQLADLEVR